MTSSALSHRRVILARPDVCHSDDNPGRCHPPPPPPPPPVCPPDLITGFIDGNIIQPWPPFTEHPFFIPYSAPPFPALPQYFDGGGSPWGWSIDFWLIESPQDFRIAFNGFHPLFGFIFASKANVPYTWCSNNTIDTTVWDFIGPPFMTLHVQSVW